MFVAAGMDTRAYRLAWPAATVVFELDRLALLDLKHALVSGSGTEAGCDLRPIGVDLLEDWTTPLLDTGFSPVEPTLWLVEGLLYFLSAHERDQLVKAITSLSAPGSRLLADYVTQTSLDSPRKEAWQSKMAASGHPWKSVSGSATADTSGARARAGGVRPAVPTLRRHRAESPRRQRGGGPGRPALRPGPGARRRDDRRSSGALA